MNNGMTQYVSLKTHVIVDINGDLSQPQAPDTSIQLLEDVAVAIIAERNSNDVRDLIGCIARGVYSYYRFANESDEKARQYIIEYTILHLNGMDRGNVYCIICINGKTYRFNQRGEDINVDSQSQQIKGVIQCVENILLNGWEIEMNDRGSMCLGNHSNTVLLYARKNL